MTRDHLGDVRQRIEDAGAGLAMNQRDMTDGRIGQQQALDINGGGRLVLGGFEGAERTAEHRTDLRQALAVGAVDQHQDFPVPWH